MVPAPEGLRIGLVDHVVDSEEELLSLATKEVQKLAGLPGQAQALTKESMRGAFADEWGNEKRVTEEAEWAWKMLSLDSTVKSLDAVIARLGNKSKL
ncbi:hypothetical protein HDV00_003104 [Rhizophlyctis rosea]|nr:hypothetical protein HDV00_003104 [Rhizophlyctis rosea]